jgi:hypothetical protein
MTLPLFSYNFQHERNLRERNNIIRTRELLLTGGSLLELSNYVNNQALERAANHYGGDLTEFLKACINNESLVNGYDLYIAKSASRQGSIDEVAIFKGLDSYISNLTVQKLPQSGANSLRLPDSKSKSIDAIAFNDDLLILIPAKCVAGTGGHQTNVFIEMAHCADIFKSLNRDELSSLLPNQFKLLSTQQLVCALLIETDTASLKAFNILKDKYQSERVWVVNHIQFQEKVNAYIKQKAERTIFHQTESIPGRFIPNMDKITA